MHRVFWAALILALGAGLALAAPGNHSGSVTTNSDTVSDSCNFPLQTGSYFKSVVTDESSVTLPNQPLQVAAAQNGDMQVTTWDQPGFSIRLCKQAAADTEDLAREVLKETQISVKGSAVSIATPQGSDRNSYSVSTLLQVKAPKDAVMNLTAYNGGISLNRFIGTAEAQTENGGISLHHSSGKLTVKAENGGISMGDCSGEVSATIQNGGLSVDLPERWEGKGLEAHLQNGGLDIAVPQNFVAGLEVTSSSHVPFVCRAGACAGAEWTSEDGSRVLRLGGPSPQIRVTTGNGGVVIRGHNRNTSI